MYDISLKNVRNNIIFLWHAECLFSSFSSPISVQYSSDKRTFSHSSFFSLSSAIVSCKFP